MGIFGFGKSGGLMNVIRCDQEEYLVWKWRPEGQAVNSTSRENSIRYGSRLRVKDGEVAVFVYNQKGGAEPDYIVGPYDDVLKTANFPVLANLVGAAWGGSSPFQAEVYFINLQKNNQINFGIPYFDVFDPRPNFADLPIPLAVTGTITFNITDYRGFIKLNRLVNFELDNFRNQIKAALSRIIRPTVLSVIKEKCVPIVQIDIARPAINDKIESDLKSRLESDFGVNLKAIDIEGLNIDKDSPNYRKLQKLTIDIASDTMQAQAEVNIKNLQDTQRINAENMEESLRIQREEAQRAQRLQTETNFMGAHTVDVQADVLKTGAQSLGQMGTFNAGSGGSGGMNPGGMMAGMMMGGAMGQQMAGMMNNLGQQMQNGMNTPPPMPNVQYHISVNGQQMGPFQMPQLQQMAQSGQLTQQTYVWKPGMANWEFAGNVPELASLFSMGTPPPPPPSVPNV